MQTKTSLGQDFSSRLDSLLVETGRGAAKRLADRLDVSPSYISDLRKGVKTNPSTSLVMVAANFFSVNEEWLRDGVGEKDALTILSPAARSASAALDANPEWRNNPFAPISTLKDPEPETISNVEQIELPLLGAAAAGKPGGFIEDGYAEDFLEIKGNWNPGNHYLLRVHGESMEPAYSNNAYVIIRVLRDGEYPPKNTDVIAVDSTGAVLKRLIYSKAPPEEGMSIRRSVPHLTSLNPDYPEHTPCGSDTPIRGIVVGIAELADEEEE